MPAEINPTVINQQSIDTGQEMTPDGGIIQQAAAPQGRQRVVASPPIEVESPEVEEVVQENQEVESTNAAEDTTDFTAFLKLKGEVVEQPEDNKSKKDPSEELEVEGREELESKSQQNQKKSAVVTTVRSPKPGLPPRDVNGIEDSELAEFLSKDMSRKAYDKILPIVREHNKLKAELESTKEQLAKVPKEGRLPDTYYSHPEGYTLSPEYKKANSEAALANTIVNFWQNQYTAIEEGADTISIPDLDQNGNLYVKSQIKVDPSTKAQVIRIFNAAQQQAFKAQAKIEGIASAHHLMYDQSLQFIKQHESSAFKQFETPEGQKQYGPMIKNIINSFPASVRDLPIMPLLAKSLLTNHQLAQIVQTLNKGGAATVKTKSATNGKSAIQRKAGPTASDTGAESGAGAKEEAEVTMDDFERVKQGY